MFHGLVSHLPGENVSVSGLVTSEATTNSDKSLPHVFANTSAPVLERLLKLRAALQHRLDKDNPHLIAAHFALYALPIYTTSFDGPLVMHFHGPWALESKAEGAHVLSTRLKSWIERTVYARASRFIVLSKAFRNVLHDRYNVPHERIHIVPGGVDVSRFDIQEAPQAARAELGWPQDRPIVLSVRRLVHRVGLDYLIQSMSHVIQHVPETCLFIAGKGPLANQLKTQIRALNLQDHVRLLGFVPEEDLPLAYRAANLTVVPTQSLEGFGLVAVESLAAGTPPLVTPVGGLPEVVRDLSPALIMQDASSDSIAEHLTAALRGDLSLPSAEDCRAFAARHYAWPVIARQTRTVYEEIV